MYSISFKHQLVEMMSVMRPFALKLTKNPEAADDLVQETLVKALVYQKKFSEGTNLKGWLYTIMKNTFITQYNRRARHNTFIDTTDNLHFINSSDYVTRNESEGLFIHEDINDAMNALDTRFRQPFELYYLGFKYQEIADQLDLPLGTVKNRIHVARKHLQESLSTYRKP